MEVENAIEPEVVETAPVDLRTELKNAVAEVKEKQADKVERKPRVKAEKSEEHEVPDSKKTIKVDDPEKAVTAPKSWNADSQSKWSELPDWAQKEVQKREQEVHKGFTKMDEERNFGKSLKEVITPYMPIIQAEGGTPLTAVRDLLNSAYVLRTGSPQQKTQLFRQLAQQYGVPLEQVLQPAQRVDPQLQALQDQVAQLTGHLSNAERTKQQQEQASIQGQINAFAADPKNAHFELVKPHMQALLEKGLAQDLQDAYDQAINARPDIRSTLLDARQAESEAKRIADTKAKTEQARKAGSSITGSPGTAVPLNGAPNRSLRDELRANLREYLN